VRFGHKVTRSSWSSAAGEWTIEVTRSDGSTTTITAGFLWMCTGYYRYDAGYTPNSRAASASAGASSTRSCGPRTSTTAGSASW
jgi:cation diffusion facilitator CzcD-associated flavoprotein CzcO